MNDPNGLAKVRHEKRRNTRDSATFSSFAIGAIAVQFILGVRGAGTCRSVYSGLGCFFLQIIRDGGIQVIRDGVYCIMLLPDPDGAQETLGAMPHRCAQGEVGSG